MDHRLFFVLGDLASNIGIGALVGMVAVLLVGPSWNMWLAMFLMMALGMLIGMVCAIVLGVFFGVIEIMVTAMFSSMASGMVVGMWQPMSPLTVIEGALIGGLAGLVMLNIAWVANTALRGVRDSEVAS